jgi:hypothetical protein
MRRMMLCSVAVLALVSAASGGNLVVNGDFSAGLSGWTQWNAPWGPTFTIEVDPINELHLQTNNSSFGVYQAISTVPGQAYTITADWSGVGSLHWVELQFVNDDGRAVYDQLDAPVNASIISKIDGWGMNGGIAGGGPGVLEPAAVAKFWYPSGLLTNTVVATGTTMYVSLKAGAASSVDAWFDNVSVTPEPATLVLLGLSMLLIRRRHA